MPGKKLSKGWRVKTESVYVYGREERLESAFEFIVPEKSIQIKEQGVNDEPKINESGTLRKSIKRKTSTRENY